MTNMMETYPEGDLFLWTSESMRHAGLSIFVTSLTTACAFFANLVSEITNIKCFATFTGTAMVINHMMMISWVPSLLILSRKFSERKGQDRKYPSRAGRFFMHIYNITDTISRRLFEKIIPLLVKKLWFIWLVLLSGLGIGSAICVFYKPRLEAPKTDEFLLFQPTDPMERFDKTLKYEFLFSESKYQAGLVVDIVWGVKAIDNGNYLDPNSNGSLILDETFDLWNQHSQQWMRDFCKKLKGFSFFSSTEKIKVCTLEMFSTAMSAACSSNTSNLCCGHSLPASRNVFNECFLKYLKSKNTDGVLGTPYFDKDNTLVAYVISFVSTQVYTLSYPKMKIFANSLNEFMANETMSAPPGIKNGWMISNLNIYDSQRSLAKGTFEALAISLTVSLIVMLIIAKNIIITVYAMITITFTIIVTEGVLVLLGWELNLFESMVFSLAIGFAVDFTIHYSVAYRLSKALTRTEKSEESIRTVGAPVLMGAVTTFLAGAAIMPAYLKNYRQFGEFLMLIMTFSWIYSTFFFQSLCTVIGPEGHMGEISALFCTPKRKGQDQEFVLYNSGHRNHHVHPPGLGKHKRHKRQKLHGSSKDPYDSNMYLPYMIPYPRHPHPYMTYPYYSNHGVYPYIKPQYI